MHGRVRLSEIACECGLSISPLCPLIPEDGDSRHRKCDSFLGNKQQNQQNSASEQPAL
jgi:hypothetical protein